MNDEEPEGADWWTGDGGSQPVSEERNVELYSLLPGQGPVGEGGGK